MRRFFQLLILPPLALGLLALPSPADALHRDDPRSRNLHPMGESFEAGSTTPFIANSDLAFWGGLTFAGRYDGFRVIDISAPGNPKEIAQVACNGNQGDVAAWGNILVRAVDRPQALPNNDLRRACEGTDTPSGVTGFEGLQIFVADNWRNVTAANLVAAVPTDCGAHTHTLVPDLANNRLIVYVSVAFSSGFAGPTPYGTTCVSPHDRIVAVEIPLNNPAAAAVINNNIPASANGCHDVAAHVGFGVNLLVGACRPNVVVWDISDPGNPDVMYETTAPGPTTWHSASLTWDGEVLVMGWEPGGGGRPACQATDTPLAPPIAGNAVQTDEMKSIFFFRAMDGALLGRWTLPRPQTTTENCTIHNYNVVPLRSRYVLVHGSYQSGTSVVDFTNPANPVEVAWVDPGPIDPNVLVLGGAWSSYWYNNFMYEHDILEGTRVYRLSDRVTAGARRLDHLNPQTQEFVIE